MSSEATTCTVQTSPSPLVSLNILNRSISFGQRARGRSRCCIGPNHRLVTRPSRTDRRGPVLNMVLARVVSQGNLPFFVFRSLHFSVANLTRDRFRPRRSREAGRGKGAEEEEGPARTSKIVFAAKEKKKKTKTAGPAVPAGRKLYTTHTGNLQQLSQACCPYVLSSTPVQSRCWL
jgi:hypothetical protein